MTETVRLRPVAGDDVPALRRFRLEPEVLGVHEWAGFMDPGFIERRLIDDGFLGDDGGWLVVTTEDSDALAGIVAYNRNRYGKNTTAWCWTIGVALLPEHRGRGIGTRAQQLLAEYLFDTSPVERLEAGTDVDNVAEQRALERAGFQREGVMRSVSFHGGRWRDCVLYSRLRTDPA